jgi:hypothetical protein
MLLRARKLLVRVHKTKSVDPIVNLLKPVLTLTPYSFYNKLYQYYLPSTHMSLKYLKFLDRNLVFDVSHIHVTYPVYLTLLSFITLTLPGQEKKIIELSLMHCFHRTSISSLLISNILFRIIM